MAPSKTTVTAHCSSNYALLGYQRCQSQSLPSKRAICAFPPRARSLAPTRATLIVQQLSLFDYIAVSGSSDNGLLEYVDHLHEHFVQPVVMKNGRYMPPVAPGYSIEIKTESLSRYEYPAGEEWRQ